ncbi:X-box-binding protein 1 [Protopterus annectens]|uniref:X-box-binding protein 1 n=1 Tax=Protopterus annectens TaxID=7888 RepID=UPI001CFC364B|nr:X-box-binding protein 1 [Protopterus annectens]
MVVVTTTATGAQKVLLISGKQAAGTMACASPRPPVPVVLPASQTPCSSPESSSGAPHRKRQRLTHLTPEEKAMRRKLKNRVAAQTARDRKKARMSELEQQVVELELENQKLHIENRLLREKTKDLVTENKELRNRLGLDTLTTEETKIFSQSEVDEFSLSTGSAESAALRLRVPLQQVQAQQSDILKKSTWILTALTLQTLSLIYCWVFWTVSTQKCSSKVGHQTSSQGTSLQLKMISLEQRKVPYQPPPLALWGPHQTSWKPLMN